MNIKNGIPNGKLLISDLSTGSSTLLLEHLHVQYLLNNFLFSGLW